MSDSYYVKMDHYSDKTESSITYEVDTDTFLKVAKAVTNYDEDYNPMEEIDSLRLKLKSSDEKLQRLFNIINGEGDWYDKD